MCYVCGENHWARDYPNRNKMKKKQVVVHAEEGKDEVELLRMSALRLVNAVRRQPSDDKLYRKKVMFIDVTLNGRARRAMIDTGATHNFIAETEAKRLGLKLEKDARHIKAVNFEAQPIAGVAKNVEIAIVSWRGTTNLTVGPLDDIGVILGMDFLVSSKAVPMPHLWTLSFMDESTSCMVPMCRAGPTKDQTLTALQLYEKVKCEGVVYYVGLEEDLNKSETVESQEMLEHLAPNRGVRRSIKHKAKKDLEGTRERPTAWRRACACCGGQAHLTARAQRQNSLHSELAGVCAQRGKALGAGAKARRTASKAMLTWLGTRRGHLRVRWGRLPGI